MRAIRVNLLVYPERTLVHVYNRLVSRFASWGTWVQVPPKEVAGNLL
jgi:hypothetical protein